MKFPYKKKKTSTGLCPLVEFDDIFTVQLCPQIFLQKKIMIYVQDDFSFFLVVVMIRITFIIVSYEAVGTDLKNKDKRISKCYLNLKGVDDLLPVLFQKNPQALKDLQYNNRQCPV